MGTDELVSCGSMSIAFAPVELCSGASDLGQDVLGLCRANIGLRFLVVLEKILFRCGDQLRQAVEDPTPHARDGEIAKKTLRHVEPRGAGRCEVGMETRWRVIPSAAAICSLVAPSVARSTI